MGNRRAGQLLRVFAYFANTVAEISNGKQTESHCSVPVRYAEPMFSRQTLPWKKVSCRVKPSIIRI